MTTTNITAGAPIPSRQHQRMPRAWSVRVGEVIVGGPGGHRHRIGKLSDKTGQRLRVDGLEGEVTILC